MFSIPPPKKNKKTFIFVNLLQENSGGRTVQTEKRKERGKKVIREGGKKALSGLEKEGLMRDEQQRCGSSSCL